MSEKLKAFFEYNPLSFSYEDMPATAIDKYEHILPDYLIETWKTYGISSYQDSFFFLVNPEDYSANLSQFLPDVTSKHVIIRTALGGLIYFDESAEEACKRGGQQYSYLCPHYLQITPFTSNLAAVMNGWLTDEAIYAPLMFYYLYTAARKRLKAPAVDECYGFNLALALGGDMSSESLTVFKIKEHLSFLSQLK